MKNINPAQSIKRPKKDEILQILLHMRDSNLDKPIKFKEPKVNAVKRKI